MPYTTRQKEEDLRKAMVTWDCDTATMIRVFDYLVKRIHELEDFIERIDSVTHKRDSPR